MRGRGGGIRTPKNGFGDRRFTVEPTPLHFSTEDFQHRRLPASEPPEKIPADGAPAFAALFHFAMRRVLAALPAKLVELETLGRGLAILGRRVVLIFAHRALQLTNLARHMPFLS
jgi:hypothetical protein